MIYLIAASIPLFLVAKWILFGDPEPVKGVYSLPGLWYPLKYVLFRILISLRRRRNASLKEATGDAGYGMRSRSTVKEMDRAQELPPDEPLAVDAVYFNGADRNGNYLVAATARRQENIVQTILLIRLPGIGLLEYPSMPETNLEGTHEDSFAAAGLCIEPVEPMKTWHLSFSGKLRHVETQKLLEVTFDLQWTKLTHYFDFDTDMNPGALSGAIAREKWSRQFFDTLKKAHQTHYEQFGEMAGIIEIENHDKQMVTLQGVRDHSYGNIRNWSDLHRYILQYLYTQDGRCVCFGAICMPLTMSRLVMGYVFHPDGRMDTLSSTDFEFYNLADDGNPPKEFTVNFIAGGQMYELKAKEVVTPVFFMGTDWGARIHERMCTFTLNGVPAWGISEWDYKNPLGRKATR